MGILNRILALFPLTKRKEKKPSLIKEVMDNPEKFILMASIEDEMIVIRIKKKEES